MGRWISASADELKMEGVPFQNWQLELFLRESNELLQVRLADTADGVDVGCIWSIFLPKYNVSD